MGGGMVSRGQINILDEIIVDNFAGGGGASTGIELAAGRVVDIAINHDPDAILMHKTNHPYTRHYQASVWDVDPVEVCMGRPVGLAWFSPDCKHFSKAKGGKPVDRNIRGLAWIVLRWAGTVSPRVIILENVEEFQTWGPVRHEKPVNSKQGQTFDKFISQLRSLGYTVEWRELVAADYGAPTTRKRFFLVARCEGKPIVWPSPTHGPAESPEVKTGLLKPWRSAAEIIDWSLPAPSIFDTREEVRERYGMAAVRPLARNTMRRVARGVDKFVIRSASPFLVIVNHAGAFRGQGLAEPLQTITAKHGYGVVCPAMIQYHTEQTERVRGQGVTDPIMTIDASNRYGLAAAVLTKYYSGDHNQDVEAPLQTITAGGGHHGVVTTRIVKADPGADLGNWPKIRAVLNEFCGYELEDTEVILFRINGAWYFMADIYVADGENVVEMVPQIPGQMGMDGQTQDSPYVQKLLSEISTGAKITFNDSGVATTIVTKKGIDLQSNEAIRPIVKLRPYRTFQEVEQPESVFLIRINERGISFVEADGGMWKLRARETVKEFLEQRLSEEVSSGNVIVAL